MAPLPDDIRTMIVDHHQQNDNATKTSRNQRLQQQSMNAPLPLSPTGKPPRSTTPSTRTKRREKVSEKQVSFSTYSEVYYIENSFEISEDEYVATYMTPSDYNRIEKEIDDTMRNFENGKPFPLANHHFRGLETHFKHSRKQRKQRISFIVAAVIKEQFRHGSLSPGWVHQYLCALTMPFAHAAHIMGIFDFQSAFADVSCPSTSKNHTPSLHSSITVASKQDPSKQDHSSSNPYGSTRKPQPLTPVCIVNWPDVIR